MNNGLRLYYGATLLFLLLDFLFGINVRVAFLDHQTIARGVYYLILFGCLALMIVRPGWTNVVAAIESLTVVVALTLTMALRVMIVTDEMIETGAGGVSGEEIVNFVVAGSVAYWSWMLRIRSLKASKIG